MPTFWLAANRQTEECDAPVDEVLRRRHPLLDDLLSIVAKRHCSRGGFRAAAAAVLSQVADQVA